MECCVICIFSLCHFDVFFQSIDSGKLLPWPLGRSENRRLETVQCDREWAVKKTLKTMVWGTWTQFTTAIRAEDVHTHVHICPDLCSCGCSTTFEVSIVCFLCWLYPEKRYFNTKYHETVLLVYSYGVQGRGFSPLLDHKGDNKCFWVGESWVIYVWRWNWCVIHGT